MRRLPGAVLRAYPPWFRARYGPELRALVEDLPPSSRTTADLFGGAIRSWLRPAMPTTGRRLQATVTTTWVAWCAGFLVVPAINRALLDPPSAGASGPVRALLTTADVLLVAGWTLALLGAAPVVHRAVIPALRARTWTVFRPLLATVLLGVVEAVGLLWLALTSGSRTGPTTHLSGLVITGIALWLIGFAAFVVSLGIGPALTLSRIRPGEPALRPPTLLTVPVAVTLTGMTGCCLAAAVIAGDATLISSPIPVALALATGCVAALTAAISSTRGLHALRTR